MRTVTLSLAALSLLTACATPQNIKDKSAASAALYTNLSAAHKTYVTALAAELERRDRLAAEIAVRTGDAKPELEKPLAMPADTREVLQSLRALGIQIDTSQLVYGVVDRFIRIDVVDVDDVTAVTAKASDAFKEK